MSTASSPSLTSTAVPVVSDTDSFLVSENRPCTGVPVSSVIANRLFSAHLRDIR